MGDRSVLVPVGVAAVAWTGVTTARPTPTALLVALAAAWWVLRRGGRRGAALAVGALMLLGVASEVGARSAEGLRPIESGTFEGVATLVGDPERLGPSVRVDLDLGGQRVEAWARGAAAAALAPRAAGERIEVRGRLAPRPDVAPWLEVRHVVGRLSVTAVGEWSPGSLPSRAANGVRRTLADGARVLGESQRPLFLGLVLGDDRGQDPLLVDAFAGSGLTHLLAVSGSNVAMVVALVVPLLGRARIGTRLALSLVVLGFFALVTRVEPSVLRATSMAGLGAIATALGWEAEGRRVLPLAVAGLLLVDPVLSRSIGFQLSVAASAGILWWSGRIALALPGPRWLAGSLAVTVAAQLAVAPLLIPAFGPLPVAAIPANLVAGPAAGLVVVWGLPSGLLAGVVAPPIDVVLHLPTRAALWVVATVAEVASTWITAELAARHLVVLLVAGLLALLPVVVPGRRLTALVVAAAVVLQAVVGGGSSPHALGPGAALHHDAGAVVVVLDREVRVDDLLDGLRRAGVDRVDVVVARDGGREVAEAVALLGRRTPPRLVLAPPDHRVPGGSVPPVGGQVRVGALVIEVAATAPRLEVEIRRARGPPAPVPRSGASAGAPDAARTGAAPPPRSS